MSAILGVEITFLRSKDAIPCGARVCGVVFETEKTEQHKSMQGPGLRGKKGRKHDCNMISLVGTGVCVKNRLPPPSIPLYRNDENGRYGITGLYKYTSL